MVEKTTEEKEVDKLKSNANKLYEFAKPKMAVLRVILQFVVGLFIFYVILVEMLRFSTLTIEQLNWLPFVQLIFDEKLLKIVGSSLLVSSAIELAYMLFTPGPDEAVDPLILSITASALIALSEDKEKLLGSSYLMDGIIILLFSFSLSMLFFLRYKCTQWFPDEKE